jgi:redox-sensing transcriptional repressor
VPEATVILLPIYQRVLADLLRGGQTTVSSEELGARAGVSAAKVRRDLSLLGSFGTRGSGYDTAFLASRLDEVLGAGQDWPVAVVGIGNLGRALVNSQGFRTRGFRVVACFDVSPGVVGTTVGGCVVRHADTLGSARAELAMAIGVIATPAAAAQDVCDQLVAIGVRSLLNFAPQRLVVPDEVLIRSVDLSLELQVMTFYRSRATPGD